MNTYETQIFFDGLFIENYCRADSAESAERKALSELCRVFPVDDDWLSANADKFSVQSFIAKCDSCGNELPLCGGCGCMTNESYGIYP